MGAYAALADIDYVISAFLDYGDTFFSHDRDLQKMFETAQNRIQSFEVFMARLDSSSRTRIKDSLLRVQEAARLFLKQITEESADNFGEHGLSFIDTLQKMEEYLKQDTHLTHDVPLHSKSYMVGLSDEYTTLKKEIVGTWVNELVFSLVGMAGIGKTALANKLFQDLNILEWFDCCAWVTIGREYQPQEITQNILAQLGVDEHNMLTEGYLRKCLGNKRCFIVLDDVWDLEMVESLLETSSPMTTENGSRVLVTTRIQHQYAFPHHLIKMRLLNKQESWNLLCEKVFVQNSCPPDLEKTGKMIAEKCDGLPLTIITVANLLSKIPGSQWIEVAEQKKHHVFIDAYDEISKVLYPSFDNLREELKLCFIYMGVFPQNFEIRKSKLINLWIVEKIIQKGKFQTSEMSCVECLQYLAMHNVVMVYQRSSIPLNGLFERIKTCGLHSSWWYFCYKEAKKNSFFHVLDSCTDASKEVIKNQSRLTIHNNVLFGIKAVNKSMEENCVSTTHSLLCLGLYHQYPVPICFGLKLLKKFDALHIRFYKFPLEVLELVKLRYLAITCNASLPSSISKLRKLQYLIVHRHLTIKVGAPSYLPIEIWDMKRLKHLHVMGNDLPDVSDTFLPKLLALSDVSFNSFTSGVLGRIPNIKKLGIQVDLMPGAVESLCCFDHISHLSELESLKYVIVNPTCNFEVVAPLVQLSTFPLNLKKLYLSGLGYPWKEVSTISSLPNLEVLKLRNNAFQGPLWKVGNDKFPKLSFLQMEDIDLEILEGRNSFKCLKKLSIKHCYNLRKLRLTMSDEFASNFEVVDCNPWIEENIRSNLSSSLNKTRLNLSAHFSFSWNS